MKLAHLKSNVRTISVPYFDESFTISYKPGELTPSNTHEMTKQIAGEASVAASDSEVSDGEVNAESRRNVIAKTLLRVLASWELEDEAGEMLPINEATFEMVPNPMMLAMLTAINEDCVPKARSARKSFAR